MEEASSKRPIVMSPKNRNNDASRVGGAGGVAQAIRGAPKDVAMRQRVRSRLDLS
jgi:hypothetical protein